MTDNSENKLSQKITFWLEHDNVEFVTPILLQVNVAFNSNSLYEAVNSAVTRLIRIHCYWHYQILC